MRSVQLQTTLRDYFEAAAELLGSELAAGAEIPFELDRQPARGARGTSLYCYRPLTEEFIAERRPALEALPAHGLVSEQMSSFEGLERYLVAAGEDVTRLSRAAQIRAAIGSLLGEVFAEQSDFELRDERVRAALDRLQSTALRATAEVTIVARLCGVTIGSPELPLAAGLTIARPDALEGLPPELRSSGEDGPAHLVVALASEEQDPAEALQRGRDVLRDLLRALRLFGDGRVTLGALGWARIGAGQWTPLALGGGGRPHGMLIVTGGQEDELRAFCNLVSRRAPDGNELAWALGRFEMGCEREDQYEALSDNLLALRALLEPEGPSSGMLAGRLAALCATPQARLALTERTVQAITLERTVIAGTAEPRAGAGALADDIADHLRALLRDVICGHLDTDLVGLADELLLSDLSDQANDPIAQDFDAIGGGEVAAHALGRATGTPEPKPAGSVPFRAPRPRVSSPAASSDAELLGDASEAEEILDIFM